MRLIDTGRDDFLSIDDNGGITGWLNVPNPQTCAGLTWSPIGGPRNVAYGEGPGDDIRIADYDGDGKAGLHPEDINFTRSC